MTNTFLGKLGAALVLALVTTGTSAAQEQPAEVRNFLGDLDADDQADFERAHPLFWELYIKDGTILLSGEDQFLRLFRKLVFSEAGEDGLPEEGYGSPDFYADVVDYMAATQGTVCRQCDTADKRKAFAEPFIKRIYGAIENRTVNGKTKKVLPPENGVSLELLMGLGEIDLEHKARGRAAEKDFVRRWFIENKNRIRIISRDDYFDYLRIAGDSRHEWGMEMLKKRYPDGFPLFFDAAFSPRYRSDYGEATRLLEQRYDISSSEKFDLADGRMDKLLEQLVDAGGRDHLERTSCEGGDVLFPEWGASDAERFEKTPENYRRFEAIDMRGSHSVRLFHFSMLKRYQYLWDAGYRHSGSRDEIIAEASQKASQTPLIFEGHHSTQPRPSRRYSVGNIDFPDHAECAITTFGIPCNVMGYALTGEALTSPPRAMYLFRFDLGAGDGEVEEEPFTSADYAAHFSRGPCGDSKMTPPSFAMNPTWSKYRIGHTKMDSYTVRLFDYHDDGRLVSERYFHDFIDVSDTVEEVVAGVAEGRLKSLVIPYHNNMVSGAIEVHVDDWDRRWIDLGLPGGGTYDDQQFFTDRFLELLTRDRELEGKTKVPLIIEMHYDKNLPHGPFRLWTAVDGKKSEKLLEGRHDYGLLLGPEGSSACRRGRCL